jgi:hypothetical protein
MRFPEMKSKRILKICCAAALVVLIFAALGPGKWQPRTGLGWQIDHVVGYFAFTLLFCLAWPRPLVIGATLVALAGLLEALQALTPDRSSNFFCGLVQRKRSAGRGSVCRAFHTSTEMVSI